MLKIFIKPLIWFTIICYGLFIPSGNLPKMRLFKIPHFDKIVHFGLFFVFALLLFVPFKKLKLKEYIFTPAVSLLFAASLEWIQHTLSSSRSSDLYDFLANSAGIVAATAFFYLFISNSKAEKYF